MLLTIHDANLQKIGFIDNEKQETLNFYDDTWTRNLGTASSTFEFTVSKKQLLSDTANKPLYNQLNERSFVSFKHKGQTYLFNIMKVEENERWIRCYCENLNLELINEYTNPYKADRPLSFAEYLDVFEIPQFAMVKIGVNEISDQKRTLEWEGQDTKLARLLSLANKFDAEVEFVTQLNDDSSIKQLFLNVYHKADDSHTGVGRIRGDIRLTFEKNIKSMTRKIDKTEVYTLVVPYGKSKESHEGEQEVRVYIDNLPPWEEKDDNGIVIFKQEGVNLYAPHAADLYPSTFGVSTQSNKWIRKDLEVDSDNPNVIRAAGIANLRKHAYPAITYEVDGFIDVEIGDTITIHDKGFTPALDVRARAVEQKISFSNPTNNKTTFGNFKELENRTSGDLRSVFEQMVENIRPYNILVSTDNGVMFKNNTGRSTIRPTLKRGNQTVPATYRFVIDGSIVSSGLTYTVKASDITKPTVITISAWVDNKEVASEEVTFVNVSDGKQGPQGPKGIDGTDAPTIFVKSYTYSAGSKAYIKLTGPNAFEQTLYYSRGHNVWVLDATTHKLKEFVHCDTYITMSFNHNGVNITLADYLNSITDSIVAIAAADADAVDQNFRDVLNKMGGNPELGTWSWRTGHVFIGMSKRSDGTWPLQPRQGYEVAIQEDGSAPEIGCTLSIGGIVANGADGKTQYTHIAYANSADGSKDFSTSDSNRAYIGMYVDFNINDSTNPSDYSWTLVKGSDGRDGIPGKPGADGKTPYFHTAWAYSADGTDGFTTVYPNLNLLEGTATFDGMNPNSSDNSVSAITKTKISGIANTVMDVKTSGNAFAVGFYTQKGYNITAGQTITISFIAKASSDTSLFVGFEHFPSGHKMFTISTKWELYTYTFTATTSGTPTFVMYGWDMVAGQGFQLYNPKAELGSVATPWMPSASEVKTADYPSFIGHYTNYTPVDSPNPRDYTWSLIRGNDGKQGPQGPPGQKGADGKTPYVHFAYADSADGQKGFSLTQTGSKRYLGVLTNFIKEDSTNPADYTWSDTAGSISVGGRNLLKGSKGPFKPDRKPTDFDNYVYYENETSVYLEQGKQYIISAKTDGNFTKWHNGGIESDNITLWLFRFWDVVDIVSDSNTGTTGTQFTWNHPTGTYHLRVNTYHKTAIKSVWEVKIEEGTIKTDWTPAIEDIQDEIDSKADAAMTIEQINALNERAAIIKAEMEAKASAEILNNWIKNYQDFVKANETERAAAEKALISSSQRVSIIAKELGELSDRWSFIDSYMTASNDGLVIGKNDGSSGIMINPNGRISMYSAGEEVMYISQGVIHIENGIFSKTIQVGRYREEQYHLNPDMNVIRYVGGF